MILGLVFALIVAACQQQGSSTESQATMQQRARDEYEHHKQAAIRMNELAGRMQTDADGGASTRVSGSVF